MSDQSNPSANGIKDKVTDQIDNITDTASRTFNEAAGQAERIAGRVVDDGRAIGGNVREVAGNLQGAVVTSIKEQPLATIAIVAVLGFVLGAIWKS